MENNINSVDTGLNTSEEKSYVEPESKEEVVDQPETKEPVENVKKNKDFKYPYSDVLKLNEDKVIPSIILPVASYAKLKEIEEHYDKLTAAGEDINKILTKDEITPLLVMLQGLNNVTKEDVYYDALNKEDADYTNNITYGDKELNLRNINFKQTTGVVSGATAVARFTALTGVGEVTQVPLWHSGFWVTLRPPKSSDIVSLEYEIAKNAIELGRQTNTLVFSNSSVIYNKIVAEFILKHITESSVKLPQDADILEYINVQDLNVLTLGMISCMYPRYIPITKACVNTTVLVDNIPSCTFVVQGKLDPKKMLIKDNKKINGYMREHMANRTPNSVSVDAVKEYQRKLNENNEKVITVKYDSVDVDLTIKNPNLKDYIKNGELWVSNIIKNAEELFTNSDTELIKNSKVSDILKSVIFGTYNTYISKIESNGIQVIDNETITNILDSISNNNNGYDDYIKTIKQYITDTAIAIVATPNYVCPECSKLQNEEAGPFKDLVPLNILESFFYLCVLRVQEYRNKNTY